MHHVGDLLAMAGIVEMWIDMPPANADTVSLIARLKADIARLVPPTAAEAERHDRPFRTAQQAAEEALRLLLLAQREHSGIKDRNVERDLNVKHVGSFVGLAVRHLRQVVDHGVDEARRSVGEDIVSALGPQVTVGAIQGARRALGLLLDSLPDYEGGAA